MPWALVRDGAVVETYTGTRSVVIEEMQHSPAIFGHAWTDAERAAIGVFPIEEVNVGSREFFQPTGECSYSFNGGLVKMTKEVGPIDVDDAKKKLSKRVNDRADALIRSSMPDKRLQMLPLKLCRLVFLHGVDRNQWPEEVLLDIQDELARFDYSQLVEDERTKRLAAVEKLKATADCAGFDWQGEWPLP